MEKIRGTFEVTLSPEAPSGELETACRVGRLTIQKRFSGPLDGTSQGQMLAVRTETQGSAAYVALERVEATLAGKSGSFYFQHCGKMDRGAASLDLTVVADSATGELTGLRGSMAIEITDGQHFYSFEYELPG